MDKKRFLIKGVKKLPFNLSHLKKERKTITSLTYVAFSEKHNGNHIINTFYKSNSNIFLLDE